jgi:hypothetical protein
MTTSSQRPQFGLASLFLAITFFAVVFGLFKALGPIALVVTATVVWVLAVVWSLRLTYRLLVERSTWQFLAWPFLFLLVLFLVIAISMLILILLHPYWYWR